MKRLITILVVFAFSFSLTSCMSHIEDANGDDTSLVSIDLAAIIESKTYSSISSLSSSVSSGDKTYCFNYEDIDYDNLELNYGKISGVTKIHCSDMSSEEELILTITTSLTEGNLEIAIVGPDNTILEWVEVNQTVTVMIPSTSEGEYFVVIGGESAKVSIDIVRNIN